MTAVLKSAEPAIETFAPGIRNLATAAWRSDGTEISGRSYDSPVADADRAWDDKNEDLRVLALLCLTSSALVVTCAILVVSSLF